MTSEALLELVDQIQARKCEGQRVELKAALGGTPKRLYPTLSSFSNQDGGGVIFFGISETDKYKGGETAVICFEKFLEKKNPGFTLTCSKAEITLGNNSYSDINAKMAVNELGNDAKQNLKELGIRYNKKSKKIKEGKVIYNKDGDFRTV